MALWCKKLHFYTVPSKIFACGAILYYFFAPQKNIPSLCSQWSAAPKNILSKKQADLPNLEIWIPGQDTDPTPEKPEKGDCVRQRWRFSPEKLVFATQERKPEKPVFSGILDFHPNTLKKTKKKKKKKKKYQKTKLKRTIYVITESFFLQQTRRLM